MCLQKEGIFLSQNEVLTQYIFGNLEFDFEFLVQEEQREEGILTSKNFVRKEEGRGIGLRVILSKRVRGSESIGL